LFFIYYQVLLVLINAQNTFDKNLTPLINWFNLQFFRGFILKKSMKKKWFVVYTKPQQELKVAEQLSTMGITNYCPTITLIKQYSDRKKKVTKPLLSSYVMVELEESDRQKVFACTGIVRYLFFLGKPAVIRASQIDDMQNHLKGVYNDIEVITLSVGDSHTIAEGPFSGVLGKVVETDNTKVKLELASLGMCITLKKQAS
jgi:transcription antitermination factor NusG